MVTVIRTTLIVALLVGIANGGRAGCDCPASAVSSHLLVTVPAQGRGGVVAGGDEEGKRGRVVRASELEVFACGNSKSLLGFDAVQTVTIEPVGASFRIVEVSQWPFGAHWRLVEVPVAEWLVDIHSQPTVQQEPRPRLPRPRV